MCGPAPLGQGDERRHAIARLARASGFPLLAEATSQARFGLVDGEGVVTCGSFEAILRSPTVRARWVPDLVIEIGAPPTSAAWATFLDEHPDLPRWATSLIGPSFGFSSLANRNPFRYSASRLLA